MNAFTEQQLRALGYVPTGNGDWKKPGPGVIEKQEGITVKPQGGNWGRSARRTTREPSPVRNTPCAGDGAICGRASATNDPREKMNGLERRFADYLEERKQNGEIKRWDFEPEKFRLADNTFYTPDFRVVENDDRIVFFETKGFWEDDARAKVKIVAFQHPYQFTAAQWIKKEWKFERFFKTTNCQQNENHQTA